MPKEDGPPVYCITRRQYRMISYWFFARCSTWPWIKGGKGQAGDRFCVSHSRSTYISRRINISILERPWILIYQSIVCMCQTWGIDVIPWVGAIGKRIEAPRYITTQSEIAGCHILSRWGSWCRSSPGLIFVVIWVCIVNVTKGCLTFSGVFLPRW